MWKEGYKVGFKIGRLKVVGKEGENPTSSVKLECECGRKYTIRSSSLRKQQLRLENGDILTAECAKCAETRWRSKGPKVATTSAEVWMMQSMRWV